MSLNFVPNIEAKPLPRGSGDIRTIRDHNDLTLREAIALYVVCKSTGQPPRLAMMQLLREQSEYAVVMNKLSDPKSFDEKVFDKIFERNEENE